ncbi:Xyloglucan galactosyltransferase KATAMARI1-like protein [Triticum urartu]|uniref:Xyloglucan galactosyltransferase KATAMARI1-like protein n=1 Tax=Triticum urartu TaxID=4572 RepID=M7ZXZ9_TRIUA|nr:Xyloglucan galactosyltransferase KATAMARI1-like protein [Triticum urartu]
MAGMYRPEPPNPTARRQRLVSILLGAFFAFQLLLFVAFRSAPPSKLASTAAATSSSVPEPPSRGTEDSGCRGGLVYVYDLPAVFNEDLLAMGYFRALLLSDCQAAGAACGALDCAEGKCIKDNALVLELFMGARFCVQPRGDSFTRRSLFDCMVAGAVPVLFWRRTAYLQYHWYLPTEDGQEGEWSVFIDRDELRAGNVTVRGVLAAIPEARGRQEAAA